MRIILVRHPQPLVAPHICYGSTDLSVSPDEQTRVCTKISPILSQTAALFSSPLQRCTTLAARLPCTSLTIDSRLAEMDFGTWEMRPWSEIPRAEIDAWANDLIHYQPGGGESVLQMTTRVAQFYADIQKLPNNEVIIVCHAGTIRLLTAYHQHHHLSLTEIAHHAAQTPHHIAYGEVHILN